MHDFQFVIGVLKNYLLHENQTKVLDKDVAKALNISQSKFATMKRRNSMPFENILKFCKRENLCCNDIFF